MKRLSLPLAATSCLLAIASNGPASLRPHYGGTARVLLHDRVITLDPAADEEHSAARDRISSLIFETLTAADDQGRAQPRLASSWSADPARRVWQFRLRLARFTDGSALGAADVVASLSKAGTPWRFTATDRQTVSIESATPVWHMPEMLALRRFAISKRAADGSLVGTGAYKLADWQQGERVLLNANDDHWGGRSYPDAIEFQMGSSLREQLLQRQLGAYAAAELTLDQLRQLEQTGQSLALSRPADLVVMVFPSDAPSGKPRRVVDPRIREALAAAIDRTTLSNALLQRRGSPASGLLPQWLTGYEFMLGTSTDRERARKLVADAGIPPTAPPLSLAYDFSDPITKLIAERIAVDAREAGIKVQPFGDAHVNTRSAQSNADAVLLRVPLASLEPSVAMAALAGDLGLGPEAVSSSLVATRPEELFEIERKALENFRILPVARLANAVWLSPNTRNWQQLPNGAWDLDELWVEGMR